MSLWSQIQTKVRNVVNRVTRPSDVTAAQRKSVKLNPKCAACSGTSGIQGHHIQPYNKFPELAADLSNFVSMCEAVGGNECHLHLAHGGDFKHYNPDIVADAAAFSVADAAGRALIISNAKAKRLIDEP